MESTAHRLPDAEAPPIFAVIDMGSTSIRMAIAEVLDGDTPRTLEEAHQPVALGHDVFTDGRISLPTTEACVVALGRFRRLLDEYRVPAERVRAVATSAVREASNKQTFINRIYIATGIQVETIDEAEVNRLTYMNLLPLLRASGSVGEERTLLVEVGGGTTDVLYLDQARVAYSHTFRLGSLRMREMLEQFRAPVVRGRRILETHITRTLQYLVAEVPPAPRTALVVQGWDVRFAASLMKPGWDGSGLARLSVTKLSKLVDELLSLSVEELVQRHRLSLQEAETVGPSLLAIILLAKQYKIRTVHAARTHFRDCLLREIVQGEQWVSDFRQHILHSTEDMAQRYGVDLIHARHVAGVAVSLFDQLSDAHGLGLRERLLLEVAALLHEVGMFVNVQAHHKHTYYLVSNSEIFGLTRLDTTLAALVARYHRRGMPRAANPGYNSLGRPHQVMVSQLAAILRTADALDRARTQRVTVDQVNRRGDSLVLRVPDADDLSLEQYALEEKGPLFKQLFGLQPVLQKGGR